MSSSLKEQYLVAFQKSVANLNQQISELQQAVDAGEKNQTVRMVLNAGINKRQEYMITHEWIMKDPTSHECQREMTAFINKAQRLEL